MHFVSDGHGLDGRRYDELCREITAEMSACSLEVEAQFLNPNPYP